MASWLVIIVTVIVEVILASALGVGLWRAWIFVSLGGLSFCIYELVNEIARRR